MLKQIVADMPQLDITLEGENVQIEFDFDRGVMYIHVDGITVFRMCRIHEFNISPATLLFRK